MRRSAVCLILFPLLGCFAGATTRSDDGSESSVSKARIGILPPGNCQSGDKRAGFEDAIWETAVRARDTWNRRYPDYSFTLHCIPSDLPWGAQTGEMVRAIYEEGVAVVVGAFDPRTAHLAAQVITRAKGRSLLVTLADDPTLTQINVPWIFRILPPSFSLQEPEERQRLTSDYTYDAVMSSAKALSDSRRTGKPLQQCYREIQMEGLTGPIRFDVLGNRLP